MTDTFRDKREQSSATRLVVLSGRDVEDAARLMKLLVKDAEADVVPAARLRVLTRHDLIDAARREFEKRRRRAQLLSEGMFGEPGWEMLLLLYVEQQGVRLSIAGVSSNLGLPPSTALRWLNYLQDKQLVEREPHPTDQRSVFLKLTAKAIEALDLYFSEAIAPAA